jgi:hypothetical protein
MNTPMIIVNKGRGAAPWVLSLILTLIIGASWVWHDYRLDQMTAAISAVDGLRMQQSAQDAVERLKLEGEVNALTYRVEALSAAMEKLLELITESDTLRRPRAMQAIQFPGETGYNRMETFTMRSTEGGFQ